ncbi:MAG: alpha/beta hydrolase [Paracoccaceae bacterium]
MLKIALTIALVTSYAEWFIRTYEMRAVYPFDKTHILPVDVGEDRLVEKRLQTPDGETLILWVAPAMLGAVTVLYLPGNAGNLALRAPRFSYFLDQGYGLVALGYRGSSGSTGVPDEATLSRDALQVFDAIPDLTNSLTGSVILYGESLGTAMAAKIAVQRRASGVVLEAPFTSFVDLGKIQYPSLDLTNILTQHWDTAAIIFELDEPLLVLHGTDDKLVPFKLGQAVFDLAGSNEKTMLPLAETGHQGIWSAGGLQAISEFMDQVQQTAGK